MIKQLNLVVSGALTRHPVPLEALRWGHLTALSLISKRYCVLLLSVFVALQSASAFDGHRRGFILEGGFGLAPLALCVGNRNDVGPAINFGLGYSWDNKNLVTLHWERTFADVNQAFVGPVYLHFFQSQGHPFFLALGAGIKLCSGPPKKKEPTLFYYDTDWAEVGPGISIGTGCEISRHMLAYGRLAVGSISHGWTSSPAHLHPVLILGIILMAY